MSLPLAALLLVAAAPTSSTSVSLQDVLQIALDEAESPRVAVARLEQAEAAVRLAWAALLPSFSVAGTYRRRAFEVSITRELDDGSTERSVLQANDALFAEARLQSTLFEARALPDIGAAEDDRAEAEAALRRSRFLLAHQVADAYVTVRVAKGALAAARRRLELARSQAAEARARRDAGLLANVDRDRAELEAVEAEVLVVRSEEAARRARLALGLLAGAPIAGELLPVDVSTPAGALPTLLEEASSERPELLAARATVAAAEDRALAPWLELVPTVSVDGVVNATNETGFQGRTFNWNLAFTLGWTLYDGGVRYAEARREQAGLDIARLELSELARTVRTEVEDALTVLGARRADVALARRRVEVAAAYAEEVRARLARGLATAVEAADAAVSLYEAEVEAATVAAELARATLDLRRAVGRWPTEERPAFGS